MVDARERSVGPPVKYWTVGPIGDESDPITAVSSAPCFVK